MAVKTQSDELRYYQTNTELRIGSSAPSITQISNRLGTYSSTVTYGPNYADWKKRIADGQNATTSLVGTRVKTAKLFSSSGIARTYGIYKPNPGDFASKTMKGVVTFIPWSATGVQNLTGLYNEAVLGYLGKVHSTYRSFQTGIFVGELRETVHLLRHPFSSLHKGMLEYLKAVKKRSSYIKLSTGSGALRRTLRRRVTKTSILNKVVADTWLEYSFGWRPFIQDIQSAVGALNSLAKSKPGWTRVSFKASKTVEINTPYFLPALGGGDQCNVGYMLQDVDTSSVRLYGAVTTEPMSKPRVVENQFGLSLAEFVPTIWELTPWSFLIDYFANVGGLIDALCTQQSRIRWTARTDVTRIEALPLSQRSMQLGYYPGPGNGSFWGDVYTASAYVVGKAQRTFVTRSPMLGFISPTLVFRVPGSSTRYLNMAALVSSSKSVSRSLLARL